MRNPDRTKKTSTPTNPPDAPGTSAWNKRTPRMAMPRSPWSSGRKTAPCAPVIARPEHSRPPWLTDAAGASLLPATRACCGRLTRYFRTAGMEPPWLGSQKGYATFTDSPRASRRCVARNLLAVLGRQTDRGAGCESAVLHRAGERSDHPVDERLASVAEDGVVDRHGDPRSSGLEIVDRLGELQPRRA